ncbi:MAG: DUF6941 family protein [Gemmatimonadota bacterium]
MVVSFALFADGANLSQEGKLNILGVFDAVQVSTMPALHPRAHLVVRLKGTPFDAGSHRVSLRWINPGGVELWSSDGQVDVATPPQTVTEMDIPLIAQLDLPLDQAGAYTMRILLNDEMRAEVPLYVRSAPPFVAHSGIMS